MVGVSVWAWIDIASSSPSAVALGVLVVPLPSYVIVGATMVIDRGIALGWRLTHAQQRMSSESTPEPLADRDDWSTLPR
jgi:hypothetical protein